MLKYFVTIVHLRVAVKLTGRISTDKNKWDEQKIQHNEKKWPQNQQIEPKQKQ